MSEDIRNRIDRQIREAEERGEFANLPGAGKPLPDSGRPLAEDWWLRDYMRREGVGPEALPTTLRLRKEVEQLPAKVERLRTEQEVRRVVEELNSEIRTARLGPVDGPPVTLHTVDPEDALKRWRAGRTS